MKNDDSEDQAPPKTRNTMESFDGALAEQSADEPPQGLSRDSKDGESEEFARLKERVRSGLYRPDMQALADQFLKDPETIELLLEE